MIKLASLPSKEITLPYSLDHVNRAFYDSMRLPGTVLSMKNEINNTYTFSKVIKFQTGIIDATFKAIDDNNTVCFFQSVHIVGNRLSQNELESMLEKYVFVFSNLASGRTVIPTKYVEEKKHVGLDSKTITYVLISAFIMFILLVIINRFGH
jgi:hypothetical protein